MIKKETLTRYFNSHSAKAVKSLVSFSKSNKPEKLHIFRVEIKKMKAVIAILKNHPSDGILRKKFRPVEMIFKQAGQIRLLDVNMKLISKYLPPDDPVLLKSSSNREKVLKKLVTALKKHQLIIKKSITMICKGLFDVEDYFVLTGIKSRLEKIENEFLRKKLRTHKLHQRRKQIKNILYVCEVLPKVTLEELNIAKEYLDNIQHEIGVWHDMELSFEIFANNRHLNLVLIKELLKEKKKQEQKIKKLTKNFKKQVQP